MTSQRNAPVQTPTRWLLHGLGWLSSASLLGSGAAYAQSEVAIRVADPNADAELTQPALPAQPAIATATTSASDLGGVSGLAAAEKQAEEETETEVSLPDLSPLVPEEKRAELAREPDAPAETAVEAESAPTTPDASEAIAEPAPAPTPAAPVETATEALAQPAASTEPAPAPTPAAPVETASEPPAAPAANPPRRDALAGAVELPPLVPLTPPTQAPAATQPAASPAPQPTPSPATVAETPGVTPAGTPDERGKNRLVDPTPLATTPAAPTVRIRDRLSHCATVVVPDVGVTLQCDDDAPAAAPRVAGPTGVPDPLAGVGNSNVLPPPPGLPAVTGLKPIAPGANLREVPTPNPVPLPPSPRLAAELEELKLPDNGDAQLLFPLPRVAAVSSNFGWRIHPIHNRRQFHTGTDFAAPEGTPVVAAFSGRVAIADYLTGYGLTVALRHQEGSQESRYAHLSAIYVQPGERVEQGQVIGRVGSTGTSTGPHLHFEWRQQRGGRWIALDAGNELRAALQRGGNEALAFALPDVSKLQLDSDLAAELGAARAGGLPSWRELPSRTRLPESVFARLPEMRAQPVLFQFSLPDAIAAALPWNLPQVSADTTERSIFWRLAAAVSEFFMSPGLPFEPLELPQPEVTASAAPLPAAPPVGGFELEAEEPLEALPPLHFSAGGDRGRLETARREARVTE